MCYRNSVIQWPHEGRQLKKIYISAFYSYMDTMTGEQNLLTRPGHLSSPPDFNGVRVTRSLILCEELCRSLFVLLSFFFCHCVVCPSMYEFWLPVWCLQPRLSWLHHFTKRKCGRFWHIKNSLVSNPFYISVYINRKSTKMFFVFGQLILKL
jgi:hypothetical protein